MSSSNKKLATNVDSKKFPTLAAALDAEDAESFLEIVIDGQSCDDDDDDQGEVLPPLSTKDLLGGNHHIPCLLKTAGCLLMKGSDYLSFVKTIFELLEDEDEDATKKKLRGVAADAMYNFLLEILCKKQDADCGEEDVDEEEEGFNSDLYSSGELISVVVESGYLFPIRKNTPSEQAIQVAEVLLNVFYPPNTDDGCGMHDQGISIDDYLIPIIRQHAVAICTSPLSDIYLRRIIHLFAVNDTNPFETAYVGEFDHSKYKFNSVIDFFAFHTDVEKVVTPFVKMLLEMALSSQVCHLTRSSLLDCLNQLAELDEDSSGSCSFTITARNRRFCGVLGEEGIVPLLKFISANMNGEVEEHGGGYEDEELLRLDSVLQDSHESSFEYTPVAFAHLILDKIAMAAPQAFASSKVLENVVRGFVTAINADQEQQQQHNFGCFSQDNCASSPRDFNFLLITILFGTRNKKLNEQFFKTKSFATKLLQSLKTAIIPYWQEKCDPDDAYDEVTDEVSYNWKNIQIGIKSLGRVEGIPNGLMMFSKQITSLTFEEFCDKKTEFLPSRRGR